MSKRFEQTLTGAITSAQVGDKTISIVEGVNEYLPFFAEALRRNMENPSLPYFSPAALAQNEIVVRVDLWSEEEWNYDRGSYQKYYEKIYCGNICIHTDYAHMVNITVNDIKWSRRHGWCEFYPPAYEENKNPVQAQKNALKRCGAFLDAFESDLAKFQLIHNFKKACQSVDANSTYEIYNPHIYWGKEELEHQHKENISIRIIKTEADMPKMTTIVYTDFEELATMDVTKYLAAKGWHKW